jgi:hypothetical protein
VVLDPVIRMTSAFSMQAMELVIEPEP